MTRISWSLYIIELLIKFYKLLRSTYKFPYTIGTNLLIKQTTFFTQYYNVFDVTLQKYETEIYYLQLVIRRFINPLKAR